MHRFDLHAAFATEPKGLQLGEFDGVLSRPRLGCFVQAETCAKNNGSGTNVIPTFTGNFLAESLEEAEKLTKYVGDKLRKFELLRIRCEYQLPSLKYEQESRSLRVLNGNSPVASFARVAKGEEYFDSHIHMYGIDCTEKYESAGSLVSLPIITNVSKTCPVPFVTQRWYNCTYEEAVKDLCLLYQRVFEPLQTMGVQVQCIPEMEFTHYDPDCQVTDAGWMQTPNTPFSLDRFHFLAPSQIKFG